MRKFGLLAALTIVGMLSFTAVAMAAPTPDPVTTNPASQGSTNNGTGVNTQGMVGPDGTTFSGQSYRMTPDSSFTGGNGGTGFDSPSNASIKYDSPSNAKIHSSYSKTSDACASCHTIHNSVNQGALLQWEDPQTACWACHDGTVTSTYNVITGTHTTTSGAILVNSAGLFGVGDGTESGLSNHGMSPKEPAFVTTAAAPGGAEQGVKDKNGDWTTEFTCVACHDPHGSNGNARILNPNVNGYADRARAQMATADANGETLTNPSSDLKTYQAKSGFWMSGHGFDPVVTVNNAKPSATQTYKVDYLNGKIVFDAALGSADVVKVLYSPGLSVKMDVQGKLTANETVKYQSGINQFCGACHTDYNNVNKVPVWLTTDGKDTSISGNNGILVTPKTQAKNADGTLKFKTGGAYAEALGEYRTAYRHSVGFTRTFDPNDKTFSNASSLDALYPGLKFDTSNPKAPGTIAPTVDCLTCHYAHGTSDDFITKSLSLQGQLGAFAISSTTYPTGYDASGNPMNAYGDKAIQTYDSSRTTALKRIPNMGVCQACHNKTGTTPQTLP